MQRFIVVFVVAITAGCSASGPQVQDTGVAPEVKLRGSATDLLSNGVFTSEIDQMQLDVEAGVIPGQEIFRFEIVIGNPNDVEVHFDRVEMLTVGTSKRRHSNSAQWGEPSQPEEKVIPSEEGIRVFATTPVASVPRPEKIVVEVKLKGKPIGQPLTFLLGAAEFEKTSRYLAKKTKGESAKMSYSGLSPKASLEKAEEEARQWAPDASLREVRANRWETFGDPETREVSEINIPECRYTFVAGDKAVSFIVSEDDVKKVEDEATFRYAEKLLPLVDWQLDTEKAVKISAEQGLKVKVGPSLRMFEVRGNAIPVWVMPGAPSVLIDAASGRMLGHEEVHDPAGEIPE